MLQTTFALNQLSNSCKSCIRNKIVYETSTHLFAYIYIYHNEALSNMQEETNLTWTHLVVSVGQVLDYDG